MQLPEEIYLILFKIGTAPSFKTFTPCHFVALCWQAKGLYRYDSMGLFVKISPS